MATLERIRNKAGLLVSIVIGFALIAFILGDFLTPGKGVFANTQVEVAEIDGQSIPYTFYQEMIERRIEAFKQQTGQTSLTEQNMITVRNEAWNDVINEFVIKKEYEGLSLDCGPDELFDMVQGRFIHPQILTTPIFLDSTGQFDRSLVLAFLNNMELNPEAHAAWLNYEKQLQANTIAKKFNALVEKALYVPYKFAEVSFNETLKKVEFEYFLQRYTRVDDSLITISEAEFEQYYEENEDNFTQIATRDIEYVSFDVFPSQKDKLAAEEWIGGRIKDDFIATENGEQFVRLNSDSEFDFVYYSKEELPVQYADFMFNGTKGDVYGTYLENDVYKLAKLNDIKNLPDSVKASHILIDPTGFGNNFESTQAFADSLVELIRNGADFANLAGAYSSDRSNSEAGGDLGWFKFNTMVRPFAEACFFADKGELLTTQTSFGVHIIKVVDKGRASKKVQIATLTRNIEPSQETIDNTFIEASKFASEYGESDKFQDGLIEKGLAKRVAPNLKEADRTIPSLDNPRELVRWAYGVDPYKTKLNDISPIFEFGNRFIIAQLTVIREEGIASLEQVRADIQTDLIRQKKAEKILAEVQTSLDKGTSLSELADEFGVLLKTASEANFTGYSINGVGVEPKLAAAVSIAEQGKLSDPIDGVVGVYVFVVTGITEPPEGDDYTGERARLMNAILANGKYRAIEALKERSNIKDYRSKF